MNFDAAIRQYIKNLS